MGRFRRYKIVGFVPGIGSFFAVDNFFGILLKFIQNSTECLFRIINYIGKHLFKSQLSYNINYLYFANVVTL